MSDFFAKEGFFYVLSAAAILAITVVAFAEQTINTLRNRVAVASIVVLTAVFAFHYQSTQPPALQPLIKRYEGFQAELDRHREKLLDSLDPLRKRSVPACSSLAPTPETVTCREHSGDVYVGPLTDAAKTPARIEHADGDVYTGETSGRVAQGLGELIYASGAKYVGPFSLGSPDGEGFVVTSSGKRKAVRVKGPLTETLAELP